MDFKTEHGKSLNRVEGYGDSIYLQQKKKGVT